MELTLTRQTISQVLVTCDNQPSHTFDLLTLAPEADSPVYDRLYTLWQRGLLVREEASLREDTIRFYRVLPTIRPYIEHYMAQSEEREHLLARFGATYAVLARKLYDELDHGGMAALIAFQSREDLERGESYVTGVAQGYYLFYWGWILQRLFDTRRGQKLTEQALEIGQGQDRQLELKAINNIAEVYRATGQPRRALELYEQALSLAQEVGDRQGEAATFNNMALIYRATGQPGRALELYEQALLFVQDVGDRAGETTALNNMALIYRAAGQPERALELYEQALSLAQEVGDRTGEAVTLDSMAVMYDAMGQPRRALELYERALPLMRNVGHRAGEAAMLNNMANVYRSLGQSQHALELYEKALLLMRQVGDLGGEAVTFNSMAEVYRAMGQPGRALELYERALPLMREVRDRAGEATTLSNLAVLLYQKLKRSQEAISTMEQAIAVLVETGLHQDTAGHTRDEMQLYVEMMRQDISPDQVMDGSATTSTAQLQGIVGVTIAVMTIMQERHAEWREAMADALQKAQQHGTDLQIEVEFYAAVLAILDGKAAILPDDHPYATALVQIQKGIAAGGLEVDEMPQDGSLPFGAELIPRSVVALLGGPQEKMAHAQYLTAIETQTTDERLKALLQVIQLGLFGSDLSQLGENLSGVYREVWKAIVIGVETGVDPRLFEMIIHNTLAVYGSAADQLSEWCHDLEQIRRKAMEKEAHDFVELLDALIGLLDAGGNPAKLGTNLTGVYARTWQAIIEKLPA
jgi:tetratricopeptide (TPR) repeat protein